jgi:hypothetical protein
MLVAACLRIDYPAANDGEKQAPESRAEHEPLGLYFGPADSDLAGLRVLLANDAEQLEIHLDSRASLLRSAPDYFGVPTSVAPGSPLHQLLGQPLRQILLGECPNAAGGWLTTAIRLVFGHDTLTFFNYGDEGRYFLGPEGSLWEAYTQTYPVQWRDNSQWLRLLGTEVSGLPYQLV